MYGVLFQFQSQRERVFENGETCLREHETEVQFCLDLHFSLALPFTLQDVIIIKGRRCFANVM